MASTWLRSTIMGNTTDKIKKGIKATAGAVKRGAEKAKDAAVRGVDKSKDAAVRTAEKVKDTTDRAPEKVKEAEAGPAQRYSRQGRVRHVQTPGREALPTRGRCGPAAGRGDAGGLPV